MPGGTRRSATRSPRSNPEARRSGDALRAYAAGLAARVIRSTGTSTEDFTVEVDDCGEPGTMDMFGIETETYSNGPSVLIGGNIQIHR